MSESGKTFKKPPMLDGIRAGQDVTFTFNFREGPAEVAGVLQKFLGADGVCTQIKVRVNPVLSACHPGIYRIMDRDRRNPVGTFNLSRITPLDGSATIAPAPAARGLRARRADPTDAQVRYALALCDRTGPGAGNFQRHDEAGFRAMDKTEISAWIDMAKDELGLGCSR